jgi:hypothetical protein
MAVSEGELAAALQGRSPEQKKIIKYFMAPDGCFSKNISDEEYDKLVWDKIHALNLRQRALDKTGFDKSRGSEIPPVEFRHWHFGKGALKKRGFDGLFRSSVYQVTWLFFGAGYVFVYQYTLQLNGDEKTERTEKYSYADIAGFSAVSESEEAEYRESGTGCLQRKSAGGRQFIRHDVFYLTIPGEQFSCAMVNTDEAAGKIRAMNAKLREKHG